MVYQTREAILAAVDAFGSARALYTDSSNGGQCSGAACQPRIEANGADMMLVAIEGSIKVPRGGASGRGVGGLSELGCQTARLASPCMLGTPHTCWYSPCMAMAGLPNRALTQAPAFPLC